MREHCWGWGAVGGWEGAHGAEEADEEAEKSH